MLSSLASLRQDQWVEPSPGWRRVALRILARKRAVSFEGGCPGRWVSQSVESVFEEAFLPFPDGRCGAIQFVGDGGVGEAVGE